MLLVKSREWEEGFPVFPPLQPDIGRMNDHSFLPRIYTGRIIIVLPEFFSKGNTLLGAFLKKMEVPTGKRLSG
jgi:hypothetical protein